MSTGEKRITTSLYFVRHGEATSNLEGRFGGHSPAPLTDLGRRQAAATGERLLRDAPDVILCSDVVRACQTADIIAQKLQLPVTQQTFWRERSVGIFDGLIFGDAQTQYPAEWQAMRETRGRAVPPGGETAHDVHARIAAGLEHLHQAYRGRRVVVVSHGIAIYHALCSVVGIGVPDENTPFFALVDNGAISQIDYVEGADSWRANSHWIRSVNDNAHLRDLADQA